MLVYDLLFLDILKSGLSLKIKNEEGFSDGKTILGQKGCFTGDRVSG